MNLLTPENIQTGLKIKCQYRYIPLRVGCTATIISFRHINNRTANFTIKWDDEYNDYTNWFIPDVTPVFEILDFYKKHRKPKKIIPDIPIDTNLPLLMAGHLQDRERRCPKKEK